MSTTAALYLKTVESDLKSQDGKPWSIELGPGVNAILGANFSGKSRITQAIELGLTGSVSDVAGRLVVKTSEEILSLFPGRGDPKQEGFVRLGLSDGETFLTMKVRRAGKTAKKPEVELEGPNSDLFKRVVLAFSEVKTALTSGADTARKTFLGWMTGKVTTEDVLALIEDDGLREGYGKIIAARGVKGGVSQLLDAAEYVKTRVATAQADQRTNKAALTALGSEDEVVPTKSDIHEAGKALAAARKVLEEAIAFAAYGSVQPAAADPKAVERRAGLVERRTQWAAHIEKKEAEMDLLVQQAHATGAPQAIAAVETAISMGKPRCLCCGQNVDLGHLEQVVLPFWQKKVAAGQEARIQVSTALSSARENLSKITDELNRLEGRLSAKPNTAPAVADPGVTVDEARAKVAAAETANSEIVLRAAGADKAKEIRKALRDAEKVETQFKDMAETLSTIAKAMLKRLVGDFCAEVSERLPEGWFFDVLLEEAGKETFRAGLRRADGSLDTGLSGAEWDTVVGTVASVVFGQGEGLHINIPEDRGWDSVALGNAIAGWSKSQVQTLVTSTVAPVGITASPVNIIWTSPEESGVPAPTPIKRPRPPMQDVVDEKTAEFRKAAAQTTTGVGFDVAAMDAVDKEFAGPGAEDAQDGADAEQDVEQGDAYLTFLAGPGDGDEDDDLPPPPPGDDLPWEAPSAPPAAPPVAPVAPVQPSAPVAAAPPADSGDGEDEESASSQEMNEAAKRSNLPPIPNRTARSSGKAYAPAAMRKRWGDRIMQMVLKDRLTVADVRARGNEMLERLAMPALAVEDDLGAIVTELTMCMWPQAAGGRPRKTADLDGHVPDISTPPSADAPSPAKEADPSPTAKSPAVVSVLSANGWNEAQINLMSRSAAAKIITDGLQASGYSILPSGALYDVKNKRPVT